MKFTMFTSIFIFLTSQICFAEDGIVTIRESGSYGASARAFVDVMESRSEIRFQLLGPTAHGGKDIANFASFYGACWLHGRDRDLEDAYRRGFLKPVSISPNSLPDGYYRSKGEGRVMWVASAWIPYQSCDINEPDQCSPHNKWYKCGQKDKWEVKYCIEKHSPSEYLVKMKTGSHGFYMAAFGMMKECFDELSPEEQSVRYENFLGGVYNSSSYLGEHYLLMPGNNSRRVSFELYKGESGQMLKRLEHEDARPGPIIGDSDRGKSYNTCGGKSYACPMFYDPEYELDEIMTIARQHDQFE